MLLPKNLARKDLTEIRAWISKHTPNKITIQVFTFSILEPGTRDQSEHALSQCETTLHCNVVSYWLGACTKWSLWHSLLGEYDMGQGTKSMIHQKNLLVTWEIWCHMPWCHKDYKKKYPGPLMLTSWSMLQSKEIIIHIKRKFISFQSENKSCAIVSNHSDCCHTCLSMSDDDYNLLYAIYAWT